MDLELLIIGGFAIFIAFRLWSVLGNHNAEDTAKAAEMNNILQQKLAEAKTENKEAKKPALELEALAEAEDIPAHLKSDIEDIRKLDANFSLQEFVQGAIGAFEIVIENFAKGKREALQFLLSKDIFENFNSQIISREKDKLEASANVIAIDESEIIDVEIKGSVCQIMVKFVSEQINFIKNTAGEIIEGSKSQIEKVSDVWTFERDLASDKPNWVVVGTQSV